MIANAKASGNQVVHALLDEGEGDLYYLCDWFKLEAVRRTEYPRYAGLVTKCAERYMHRAKPREAEKYLEELKRLAGSDPDPTAGENIAKLERRLSAAEREEAEWLEKAAAKLPDLQVVGKTDGPPTITIVNASVSTLNLRLGHDLGYLIPPAEVAPGKVSNDRFGPCHNKVPTFSETVPAGIYEAKVVVRERSAKPFSGVWKLVDGNAYALCLYIKTSRL
jgi:hypothetical protein